jgi:hypothetical protein
MAQFGEYYSGDVVTTIAALTIIITVIIKITVTVTVTITITVDHGGSLHVKKVRNFCLHFHRNRIIAIYRFSCLHISIQKKYNNLCWSTTIPILDMFWGVPNVGIDIFECNR